MMKLFKTICGAIITGIIMTLICMFIASGLHIRIVTGECKLPWHYNTWEYHCGNIMEYENVVYPLGENRIWFDW